MPFKLWPAQCRVLWQFLVGRLFIILKARQLGISWLCCSYALWLTFFQPGKVVLLFSQGEAEALELLRRIKVLYERLPEWMRDAGPKVVIDNTTLFGWSNGSLCRSLPATKRAGRSFTASLVILDEAAHLTWADDLYTALKPTIDGGGTLIMLSSANGLGNLFHGLWLKAEEKKNKFVAIFLPWWSRPERTQEWYDAQVAEATDPAKVKQEYPANSREAFITSGRVRFPAEWLEKQDGNIREPLEWEKLPAALRNLKNVTREHLRVYKLPEKGRKYVIGADVAEGKAKGDYSTAVVIDRETWEEVCTLHGHWEPDAFADLLLALSDVYGPEDAGRRMIAHERNNHGHAVTATVKLRGRLDRMYRDAKGEIGHLTNSQSKGPTIDGLAEALRDGSCVVRSKAALAEMQIYAVEDDGDTNAPGSYHDDLVMAWSIAVRASRSGPRVIDTAY